MLGRVTALAVHQNRFAEVAPESPEKPAELVKPLLALYLSQVNVEVNFFGRIEPEDHEHVIRRPDPQRGALRTGCPSQYRCCGR